MNNVDETKSALQATARSVWNKAGRKGTIAAGTGAGKTKIAIDEVYSLFNNMVYQNEDGEWINEPHILIVVPTEVLRDTNWPAEFAQWYPEHNMIDVIASECYASLAKVTSSVPWDLVIFDECHHLTVGNTKKFFENNLCLAVMGLTATPPKYNTEPFKYDLLEQYCPVIFRYSLDQGVDDGIIADFTIMVISNELCRDQWNIEAGPKGKKYMTTEAARYQVLKNTIKKLYKMGKDATSLQFMLNRFLYNLPSKTALAFKVISHVLFSKGKDNVPRTLIFCGSIDQCEALCRPYTWHSKRPDKKKKPTKANPVPEDDMMDKFIKGEFPAIGVVDAADEGLNIPLLDAGILVQCKKSERQVVQRIGRVVRKREGHVGRLFILYTKHTDDESWVKAALENFDPKRITWISGKEFLEQDLELSP